MLRYLLATRALHPQATGLSLEGISVKPCEKLLESISISIRRASASAVALAAGGANNILGQSLVSVLPLLNSGLDFSVRDCVDPAVRCCAAGSSPPGVGRALPLPSSCPKGVQGISAQPRYAGDVITLELVAEEEVLSKSFAIIFASSGSSRSPLCIFFFSTRLVAKLAAFKLGGASVASRAAVSMVTQKYPFLHSHGFSRSQPPLLPEDQEDPDPVLSQLQQHESQCHLGCEREPRTVEFGVTIPHLP